MSTKLEVGTIFRIPESEPIRGFCIYQVTDISYSKHSKIYSINFITIHGNEDDGVHEMRGYSLCPDDIVILEKPNTDGTENVNNNVTHPEHYTKNTMECLTFITNYKLDYFIGNAVKYIWRHKHKNGEEDLRKAVYYLSERIKCDDSWNTRDENFEYQPIDHTKLEDMDSVQLAILYSLSLVVTCEGDDKLNRIRATIKLLEGYIDEQYN